ncbi:unnamed protein product [Prunus brigantina]
MRMLSPLSLQKYPSLQKQCSLLTPSKNRSSVEEHNFFSFSGLIFSSLPPYGLPL